MLALLVNLIVSGFQWAGPGELSHLTSAACMLKTQPFEGFNIAAAESNTLKSEDQFATIDLNCSNHVFKDPGDSLGRLPSSPSTPLPPSRQTALFTETDSSNCCHKHTLVCYTDSSGGFFCLFLLRFNFCPKKNSHSR